MAMMSTDMTGVESYLSSMWGPCHESCLSSMWGPSHDEPCVPSFIPAQLTGPYIAPPSPPPAYAPDTATQPTHTYLSPSFSHTGLPTHTCLRCSLPT